MTIEEEEGIEEEVEVEEGVEDTMNNLMESHPEEGTNQEEATNLIEVTILNKIKRKIYTVNSVKVHIKTLICKLPLNRQKQVQFLGNKLPIINLSLKINNLITNHNSSRKPLNTITNKRQLYFKHLAQNMSSNTSSNQILK